MKAKKKMVDILTVDQLGVVLKQHLSVVSITEPLPRKAGIKVQSVAELVEKLKNDAKVLA